MTDGAIYSIGTPVTGMWSVVVNGSGNLSVKVSGISTLHFTSFEFGEIAGRPGHEGFLPITGFPIAGRVSMVDALISAEDVSTASFQFRSKEGAVLQTLSLQDIQNPGGVFKELSGEVSVPTTPFLIYATGLDINGNTYQRVLPSLVKPQTVRIIVPSAQELRPGQTTSYTFQVQNLGATNAFRFSGSDDKGFLSSISPTTFTLNMNQTIDVIVTLQPPNNVSTDVLNDTLTVAVESTGTTGASNSAVLKMPVNTDVEEVFDVCLRDDSNGNIFQFNSTTGAYLFKRCSNGFTLNGTGTVVIKGSIITLQDSKTDRRVSAQLDNALKKGTASVQVFSLGTTFTVSDRDTANSTCTCP